MSEPQDSPLTPERIVAFVDDELPDSERSAIAAAVAADPAAQAMASLMRRSGVAARAAYKPLLTAPVPARLTALFDEAPAVKPAPISRSPRWLRAPGTPRLALAASLAALLLGLAGGWWLSNLDSPLRPASSDQTDSVASQFDAVLFRALDQGRPADTFDYAAPGGTAKGRVTIVGELPTRAGMTCREFRHDGERSGAAVAEVGVACRNPGGGWETIILP
jgi:anti-sigma factor RsiW